MKLFSDNYLKLLETDLKGINLTRILTPEEFYNKQIIDSILPLEKSSIFLDMILRTGVLVDIGFGGGFPIVPLAYRLKNDSVRFLGFEAREKKVTAVKSICSFFNLESVSLFHHRVEDIFFDIESVVTFKAVGDIAKFLSLLNVGVKITVAFYKGANLDDLENLAMVPKNWLLVERERFSLPSGEKREILLFQNQIVPRGTIRKNNSKKMIKSLSNFLI